MKLFFHLVQDKNYISLVRDITTLRNECISLLSNPLLSGRVKYSLNPNFIYHSSLIEKKSTNEIKLMESFDENFNSLLKKIDELTSVVYSITREEVTSPFNFFPRRSINLGTFSYVYYEVDIENLLKVNIIHSSKIKLTKDGSLFLFDSLKIS